VDDNEASSHKAAWQIEKSTIASDWMDSSHVSWFNSMFDKFKIAIAEGDILNEEIRDAFYCINSIMGAYESINKSSAKVTLSESFSDAITS